MASPPPQSWPHASVLVVDDEPGMVHFITRTLASVVGEVRGVGSAEEGQTLVDQHRFDLVVLDVSLPGRNGLDWLQELRRQGHSMEVVMITAFADLDAAITALRSGAGDFLLKPFRVPQILNAVQQCLQRAMLRRENFLLRRDLSQLSPKQGALVGSSLVMRGLQAAIAKTAAVDSTVLLSGESGTGKELAALALHEGSRRSAGPFVPVNCAMLGPETAERELFGEAGRDGLFVYAQGGTLFLDEVAEMPMAQQASLLRVLEERRIRPVGSRQEIPVDVRIVAATNRALAEAVSSGRFRQDLYYRLAVVEIRLAPLRSHKDDLEELVAHFMALLGTRLGLPPVAVSLQELAYMREYDWPGNVRELRNFIERSLILGSINLSALYPPMPSGADAAGGTSGPAGLGAGPPTAVTAAGGTSEPAGSGVTNLQALERLHIEATLRSVGGDKARAAELLGISRRTLERRAAEWSLE